MLDVRNSRRLNETETSTLLIEKLVQEGRQYKKKLYICITSKSKLKHLGALNSSLNY
jgi:hypothetical protein